MVKLFMDNSYQRCLEQVQGRSNAQTLFGMHQIPTDHQIRILLDPPIRCDCDPYFSICSIELSINNFTILNQCVMMNADFMFLFNSIS